VALVKINRETENLIIGISTDRLLFSQKQIFKVALKPRKFEAKSIQDSYSLELGTYQNQTFSEKLL